MVVWGREGRDFCLPVLYEEVGIAATQDVERGRGGAGYQEIRWLNFEHSYFEVLPGLESGWKCAAVMWLQGEIWVRKSVWGSRALR